MSEVDLGLRLFLMDAASGGLFSFNGVLNMVGGTLFSVAQQGMMLTQQLDALALKAAEAQAEFAAGNITSAELNQTLAGLSAQADPLAAQLDTMGTALVGLEVAAGAAIDLGLFGSALHTVIEDGGGLQDALAKVQIAVEGTDTRFNDMKNTLVNLANNSIYTTQNLADGFQILGERGYTASQIIDDRMGPALVNLAEAIGAQGSQGVVGAAGLLSTAMELFHAKASDAAHYADVLTYAFYNGIPSADSLRSALEAVGGRAELLHIPIGDIVVALDALARAGMNANQAGSSLNYMLTALSAPIPKAQKALADLGLMAVNSTAPALKKLEEEVGAAGGKTADATKQFDGSVSALQDLFKAAQSAGIISKDTSFMHWAVQAGILSSKLYDAKGNFIGLGPALDLISGKLKGMSPELRADILSNLFNVRSGQGATQLIENLSKVDAQLKKLKQSHDAHGLSMKDAGLITQTFDASMKELGTTLHDFAALIGLPIVQGISGFVKQLNALVSGISSAHPGLLQFIGLFLIIGTVLSVVGVIVGIGIVGLAVAATALGTTLAPIIGVVALVAVGIAALSAALAGGSMSMKSFNLAASPIGQAIGRIFGDIRKQLAPMVSEVSKDFGEMMKFMGGLKAPMGELGKSIANSIEYARPALTFLVVFVGGVLLVVLRALIAAIGGALPGVFHALGGVLQFVVGVIQVVIGIISLVVSLIVGIFLILTGHSDQAQHMIMNSFLILKEGVINIFVGLGHALVGLLQALWGALLGILSGLISGIISWFHHLSDVLVGHSIIPDMVNSIIRWIASLPGRVLGFIASLVGSAISHFLSFRAQTISVFQSIPSRIVGALSSLGGMLLSAGRNAMNMLASGIASGIGWVISQAQNAANAVKNILGFHSPPKEGPLADSDQYMPNMMKMYAKHITEHTPLLQSAMHGAASSLAFTSPGVQSALNSSQASRSTYSGSSPSGGTKTIQLHFDGKCVTEVVMDNMMNVLSMNGSNRVLR